uniref:Glycoside hydrolase family 32 protein n=1 Tax=Roseihalotalea indica TaxID=2867963 RepID=A0AA49GQC3_9BACT|nr:glycoside hydrolase family 32 protein [Tunicatimonas sp. TK19036]
MRTGFLLLVLSSLAVACTQPAETSSAGLVATGDSAYYQEKYRPAYHFTPEKNWMNDPNGLVYYEGEYHLFFQYNPEGTVWGNMSWGHAVSPDLVHWEHLPLAIPMVGDTMIFSGSAVVDQHNSSGLCEGESCLVAIYTAHTETNQSQSIAVSNDRGRTWQQYSGNPVLNESMKDFRDPKVSWYEPAQHWVMTVALPTEHKVRFYKSENLLEWEQLSEFGPQGFVDGIWECPDLFSLPVSGTDEEKWVLIVSYNGEEGSDMQYFVGDFDGTRFTNENAKDLVLTLDEGLDNYAAVTWNNAPDNQRLIIGWFNNWRYARDIPTSTWRSAQTIVSTAQLRQYPEGVRLALQPVPALEKLRQTAVHHDDVQLREGDDFLSVESIQGGQLEILAEFAYEAIETPTEAEQLASEFGIKIFKGQGQETVIGYDVASQSLFVDRTQSGDTSFANNFSARTIGLMPADSGTVKMHIFVDHSSVEVFGNDGYVTMSNRIFPDPQKDDVEVYTRGGRVTLQSLDIWPLRSIWSAPASRSSASSTP